MSAIIADAYPRKRFFIQMFTRDIPLDHCVLDLIDNSIDSMLITRKVELSEDVLLGSRTVKIPKPIPEVRVRFDTEFFEIKDNCGGIPIEKAKHEVFTIGHGDGSTHTRLGAYGVGLKRALFKLGRMIEMESKTIDEGFTMNLDVDKWSSQDSSPSDWSIRLSPTSGAGTQNASGTKIRITRLNEEAKSALQSGVFIGRLIKQIASTYAFFLSKFISVYVNDELVQPELISFGFSPDYEVAVDAISQHDVSIRILCGLAPKSKSGEWKAENAGWYVLCNGRIVLSADKTWKTGWSEGLPGFHSKYRLFVGLVFFHAENPLDLPWTTTKRDVNVDSELYQLARNSMILSAKPVLTFLNQMYPSEAPPEVEQRRIAESVQPADVGKMAIAGKSSFKVKPAAAITKKATTRVQFDADNEDLKRIRTHIIKPRIPANQIGEMTFKYYLEMEGLSE